MKILYVYHGQDASKEFMMLRILTIWAFADNFAYSCLNNSRKPTVTWNGPCEATSRHWMSRPRGRHGFLHCNSATILGITLSKYMLNQTVHKYLTARDKLPRRKIRRTRKWLHSGRWINVLITTWPLGLRVELNGRAPSPLQYKCVLCGSQFCWSPSFCS